MSRDVEIYAEATVCKNEKQTDVRGIGEQNIYIVRAFIIWRQWRRDCDTNWYEINDLKLLALNTELSKGINDSKCCGNSQEETILWLGKSKTCFQENYN